MASIKGKAALITGAGRGIGRSTAIALAKEGVNLGLLGLNPDNLEKVKTELQDYDIKVSIASGDVADLESVTQAVEQIKSELGSIDILINNAGIAQFGGFLELSPEEWKK